MPAAPRGRRGFKVAIFCALPLEAEAVQSVLDTCWEDLDKEYGKEVGDQNTYTTGVIGKHNIVLVHMPSMGIANAALSAAGLRSSFPGVQLALVVGICGVVPIHIQTHEEIVLGDIIISTAVIQYDFCRQFPNEFKRKKAIEDSLGRANPEIRAFLNKLQTRPTRRWWITKLAELARSSSFQKQVRTAEYPGASLDRLFEASYTHQHRLHMDCDRCHDNHEVCPQSCDALGCEEGKTVIRNRHVFPQTEDLASLPFGSPFIHLGRFGSASTVMKSGLDRDRVAETDEIIAFEMEGAGVWEQHPTIVIKAACDYADSHKNKRWQSYAAAMAAACLKVFLTEWVVPDSHREEVTQPLWHVPFNKKSGFVGRSDELSEAKTKLFDGDDCPMISLLGLGGVGKSRLALELAHLIQTERPQCSVLWVQAEKVLTFEEDILQIGRKLGIPGIDDAKADIKALVKQRLQNWPEEKWFLILDNADDEMLWGRQSDSSQQELSLVDCLPRTPNGSILVTTRSRHVATFLAENEVVHLDALSPVEAAEMFTNRIGSRDPPVDQKVLKTLLEKLTNLPLAIVQASSFIKRTQCSIYTYLELLDQPEEAVIRLLSKDFGDQSRYPHAVNPIASTWLISFRHIREHHPLAAAFLSSMACLHEKAIPLSLLPEADSKIDTVEAIGVLTGYSFAEKRTGSKSISDVEELYDVHRLVQLAARNWLKMEDQLPDWIKACTVRLAGIFPMRNHEYKSIWSMYLPHGQRLCENEGDFPERYHLLEKMGLCHLVDGKYDEAVKAHTMVVYWREEKLGISDEQTLQAYNNLGEALNWKGDWTRAKQYLQRAFDGQKELFGQENSETLTSMANLASTYRNQGRWTQAEELDVQVMETRKRVLGAEHPDTLTIMANLASTYWNQGRWTQAEELDVQGMETRKRVFGVEHPDTLISMANLASTYRNQGRWTQAEELDVQVMETSLRVLGAEHPSTLSSMANLASTYRNQGRWTQAEELDVQVVETRKRVLGAEHPSTLTSINNLAMTHLNQGRWTQAEELNVQVMETRKRVLGAEHPSTLISMNNLAHTYMKQQRKDDAITLVSSCADLCFKVFGPSHPHTETVINTLLEWASDGLGIGEHRE